MAVVLDLYSRRVVGWSKQSTMTAQLVMVALLMAILLRGRPEAVLHPSDQARNMPARTFSGYWNRMACACSMSHTAIAGIRTMESFFSTLKTERLGRRQYRTATNYAPMSSVTLKGSTTQNAGIRLSATSTQYNLKICNALKQFVKLEEAQYIAQASVRFGRSA